MAEGVGVVAHVDGQDRVLGNEPAEYVEQRGRVHTAPLVGKGSPSRLLGPPSFPACGDVGALFGSVDVAELVAERLERASDLAPQRHVDGVELAERHPVEVDLDGRLLPRDPGVVRERGTEHEQGVGAAHDRRTDRSARTAEDAAAERVVVADGSLCLEGGDDRCVDLLGESEDLRAVRTASVADDDHGPLGTVEQCDGPAELVLRRGDADGRYPPGARPWRRVLETGELL